MKSGGEEEEVEQPEYKMGSGGEGGVSANA